MCHKAANPKTHQNKPPKQAAKTSHQKQKTPTGGHKNFTCPTRNKNKTVINQLIYDSLVFVSCRTGKVFVSTRRGFWRLVLVVLGLVASFGG
jgi:hypothetical protein